MELWSGFVGCAAALVRGALSLALAVVAALSGVPAAETVLTAAEQESALSQKQSVLALVEGKGAAAENSALLQTAIDEASEAGGGTVYLGAGEFYFARASETRSGDCAIVMRDNVRIAGAGMGKTVLKPLGRYDETGEAPHGIDMFYYNGLSEGAYLRNADFEDFTIDAAETQGSDSGYNASGKGFFFQLFEDCDWKRVEVRNTDGTGFGADFPLNCTMTDCVAIGCGKNADADSVGASGFGVGTGYSAYESMTIKGCVSQGNAKYGFFFEHQGIFEAEGADAMRARGYLVEGCTASGNLVNFGGNRAHDVRYAGCVSKAAEDPAKENYTTRAFAFTNHSVRITVEGGRIDQDYEDVSEVLSCHDAVMWALACDVAEVGAFGHDEFRPASPVTRGELAAFLWRYAGRPGEVLKGWHAEADDPARDVPLDSYYSDAVRWLHEDGLSEADPFRPDDLITKGELLLLLRRYAALLSEGGSEAASAASAAGGSRVGQDGADALAGDAGPSASDDEASAAAWAREKGIVAPSFPDNELSDTCARGEALQMLRAFDAARKGA